MKNPQFPPWESLFAAMEEHLAEQTAQKNQGLNDFTLLGSVLSVNDEVRLHTRFIYALLNPMGTHYKGALFLELFLSVVERRDWLDLSAVTVHKEYCPDGQGEQIDLIISDGKRQVIIENKLNAQDQSRQVARYLEAVGAIDPGLPENTLFIYLTKDRRSPSTYGLGGLSVCHKTSYLLNENGQPVAQYLNLSYRRKTSQSSIHVWLEACAGELNCESNIAWAIRDYQTVVERATREYVSNVKTLQQMLDDSIAKGKRHHEQAIQLCRELPMIHAGWLERALTEKMEDIFETLIEADIIIKIGEENAELLKPFLHSRWQDKATDLLYKPEFNFFRRGKGNRGRGAFYRLEAGPLAKKAVLILFYGSKMLHVGCLLTECPEKNMRDQLEALGLAEAKTLERVFPGALTYAEPLRHQGIIHLADFNNSKQRDILQQLAKVLGCNGAENAKENNYGV